MARQEVIIAESVENEDVETSDYEECLQRVVFATNEIPWHVDLSHLVENDECVNADAKRNETENHDVDVCILERELERGENDI